MSGRPEVPPSYLVFRAVITAFIALAVLLLVLALLGSGPFAPWLAAPAGFLHRTLEYWMAVLAG